MRKPHTHSLSLLFLSPLLAYTFSAGVTRIRNEQKCARRAARVKIAARRCSVLLLMGNFTQRGLKKRQPCTECSWMDGWMETIIFERLHFLLAGASDHENATPPPLGAGDTGAMFALFKRARIVESKHNVGARTFLARRDALSNFWTLAAAISPAYFRCRPLRFNFPCGLGSK